MNILQLILFQRYNIIMNILQLILFQRYNIIMNILQLILFQRYNIIMNILQLILIISCKAANIITHLHLTADVKLVLDFIDKML